MKPPRGPLKERRALSTIRSPGRVDADGDRALARALVQALEEGRDREVSDSLTHPLHAYPARMHPGTARRLIEIVMDGRPNGTLLDPFCGSGTTLVEARAAGLRAIGNDLNPLAVMLSRAKTWTAPIPRRRALRDEGKRIAADALAAGKAARRAGFQPPALRGPAGFDPNARNRRLSKWFAPHVRRELEEIAAGIDELRGREPELAELLTPVLSAILYKVSSRASDTDPSWVERHVARGAAARLFLQRVELLYEGLDEMARVRGPLPEVYEVDARSLVKQLGAGTIAGVVTSPPYAGTYDYAEQHRLRFDFLGLRHRAFGEGEIGARRGFDARAPEAPRDLKGARDTRTRAEKQVALKALSAGRRTTPPNLERAEADARLARAYAEADARDAGARQWRRDLEQIIDMIAGVLVPGGRAALVIGDSLAGGHAMFADDDVRAALGDDLELAAWASETRPKLGGAERSAFGDRYKCEHVLLLVRR